MNIIRNQLRYLASNNDYVNIDLLLHNVINEEKLIRKKKRDIKDKNTEEYFFENMDKIILLQDVINDMMIKDDIPLQKTNEVFYKAIQNNNLTDFNKLCCINKQINAILIKDHL